METTTAIPSEESRYEWFNTVTLHDLEIVSVDGLKLHGYFIEAEAPTNKTVILAHGYACDGKEMIDLARFYHDKPGYNVLMPDDRGHGESEGNYIGYGWPDRKDYLQWIDYIIHTRGENSEIVLHGASMGGAAVLMTGGKNCLIR